MLRYVFRLKTIERIFCSAIKSNIIFVKLKENLIIYKLKELTERNRKLFFFSYQILIHMIDSIYVSTEFSVVFPFIPDGNKREFGGKIADFLNCEIHLSVTLRNLRSDLSSSDR